jgi:hypothetical protein
MIVSIVVVVVVVIVVVINCELPAIINVISQKLWDG